MKDYTLAEERTAEATGKTVEQVHEFIETYMSCMAEIAKERREKIIKEMKRD